MSFCSHDSSLKVLTLPLRYDYPALSLKWTQEPIKNETLKKSSDWTKFLRGVNIHWKKSRCQAQKTVGSFTLQNCINEAVSMQNKQKIGWKPWVLLKNCFNAWIHQSFKVKNLGQKVKPGLAETGSDQAK